MKIHETFLKAAERIERYGFKQGKGLKGGGVAINGPCCVVVAIDRVVRNTAGQKYRADSLPALSTFAERIGLKPPHDPVGLVLAIAEWNDMPGRTKADVIEALKVAALIEAAAP